MEKKKKDTKFKQGNKKGKGRPKGSTTIPGALKILNRTKIEETISKYIDLPKRELIKIQKSVKTTTNDLMIIAIILKAIKTGDFTRVNFLYDRTVGKVKDKLDIKNPDGNLRGTVIILPSNGREKKH